MSLKWWWSNKQFQPNEPSIHWPHCSSVQHHWSSLKSCIMFLIFYVRSNTGTRINAENVHAGGATGSETELPETHRPQMSTPPSCLMAHYHDSTLFCCPHSLQTCCWLMTHGHFKGVISFYFYLNFHLQTNESASAAVHQQRTNYVNIICLTQWQQSIILLQVFPPASEIINFSLLQGLLANNSDFKSPLSLWWKPKGVKFQLRCSSRRGGLLQQGNVGVQRFVLWMHITLREAEKVCPSTAPGGVDERKRAGAFRQTEQS